MFLQMWEKWVRLIGHSHMHWSSVQSISFQNCYCTKKEKIIKLFTEWPPVAWNNASCIFLYGILPGFNLRDLKMLAPSCTYGCTSVVAFTVWPRAVAVDLSPKPGHLSLTLLTFFQLTNKLTDLPYPILTLTPEKYSWGGVMLLTLRPDRSIDTKVAFTSGTSATSKTTPVPGPH